MYVTDMVSIWVLSSEQRSAVEQHQWDWQPAASNADRLQAARSIANMYALMELPAPQIIWCDGTFQLAAMPFLLNVLLAQDTCGPSPKPIAPRALIAADLSKRLTHPLWQKTISNLLGQLNPAVEARLHNNGTYTQLNYAQSVRKIVQKTCCDLEQELHKKMRLALADSVCVEIRRQRDQSRLRSNAMRNQLYWHMAIQFGVLSADLFHYVDEFRHDQIVSDAPAHQLIEQLGEATCQQLVDQVWRPDQAYYAPQDAHFGLRHPTRLHWQVVGMLRAFEFRTSWSACSPDNLKLYQIPPQLDAQCYSQALIDQLETVLAFRAAAMAYNPFRTICFVSDFPTVVKLNNNGRFHCTDGPAMAFADGYEMYALGGLTVDKEIIANPASLTAKQIELEPNIEMRRVLMDLYGLERFIKDSRAVIRSVDEYGVLYEKHLTAQEPVVVVQVTNSTPEPDGTFKQYFLRVPPNMMTPREAIAWTFGMTADEYGPAVQT